MIKCDMGVVSITGNIMVVKAELQTLVATVIEACAEEESTSFTEALNEFEETLEYGVQMLGYTEKNN